MSAFVVDVEHVKALAAFAVVPRPGGAAISYQRLAALGGPYMPEAAFDEIASDIATILLRENVRSVNCRYRDDTQMPAAVAVAPSEIFRLAKLSAVQILKLCQCLHYQSCETPDYEDTVAHRLLVAIRSNTISMLPGYAMADWELKPETVAAIPVDAGRNRSSPMRRLRHTRNRHARPHGLISMRRHAGMAGRP